MWRPTRQAIVLSIVIGWGTAGTAHAAAPAAAPPEPLSVNDNRTVSGHTERRRADGSSRSSHWRVASRRGRGFEDHRQRIRASKAAPCRFRRHSSVSSKELRSESGFAIVWTNRSTFTACSRGLRHLRVRMDVVSIPAGDVRETRLVAGAPGTYFYWAAPNADLELGRRAGSDGQLSGALIVDPRGQPRLRRSRAGGHQLERHTNGRR